MRLSIVFIDSIHLSPLSIFGHLLAFLAIILGHRGYRISSKSDDGSSDEDGNSGRDGNKSLMDKFSF